MSGCRIEMKSTVKVLRDSSAPDLQWIAGTQLKEVLKDKSPK
jgi:hypothetical protein